MDALNFSKLNWDFWGHIFEHSIDDKVAMNLFSLCPRNKIELSNTIASFSWVLDKVQSTCRKGQHLSLTYFISKELTGNPLQ